MRVVQVYEKRANKQAMATGGKKRNKNYTRTRAFTMTNSELCDGGGGGGGGGTKHRPTRPLSEKEKGDTQANDMGIG